MRDVYVVGAGMHPFGRGEGVGNLDMAEHAVRAALADCGLAWSDIDFAAGGSSGAGRPDTLVDRLGLTGVPFATVRNGCATGGVALATVAAMLRAGDANIGLAVGFDKHERGAFDSSPDSYGLPRWYGTTGMMVTTQYFAMRTRRYLHDHGVPEATLAQVAARAYRNGAAHPFAFDVQPRPDLVEEQREQQPAFITFDSRYKHHQGELQGEHYQDEHQRLLAARALREVGEGGEFGGVEGVLGVAAV